jgi:hypothetical protein
MNDTQQDYKYDRAKAYIKELKEFYTHLITYLIMVPVFIFINYFTGSSFRWARFAIGGWGLGVLGRASHTCGWNPLFNKDWEKRKIEEFLRNDEF